MKNIRLKSLLKKESVGYSLKKLPKEVENSLSYTYNDTNTIKQIGAWVKKNISKFEQGKSVYSVSNGYKELKPFADKLDDTAEEIGGFIETAWEEIEENL